MPAARHDDGQVRRIFVPSLCWLVPHRAALLIHQPAGMALGQSIVHCTTMPPRARKFPEAMSSSAGLSTSSGGATLVMNLEGNLDLAAILTRSAGDGTKLRCPEV